VKPRWWRIAIVFERDGDPWTQTFHVRARTEEGARRLVADRVGSEHRIYACVASEPLARVEPRDEIVATYGPYRRSWEDPMLEAVGP